MTLWPTQVPIKWFPGGLPLGVKRRGREADHSFPSISAVKMSGTIPPLHLYASFYTFYLTENVVYVDYEDRSVGALWERMDVYEY
jgi:hypothetical protein